MKFFTNQIQSYTFEFDAVNLIEYKQKIRGQGDSLLHCRFHNEIISNSIYNMLWKNLIAPFKLNVPHYCA